MNAQAWLLDPKVRQAVHADDVVNELLIDIPYDELAGVQIGENFSAGGGFIEFRGVQQRLGGHAADIEAGAAQGDALFDNGRLQAELTGADRRVVAAGAAADDDDVVLSHLLFQSLAKRRGVKPRRR